jgi:hypothetical protein
MRHHTRHSLDSKRTSIMGHTEVQRFLQRIRMAQSQLTDICMQEHVDNNLELRLCKQLKELLGK